MKYSVWIVTPLLALLVGCAGAKTTKTATVKAKPASADGASCAVPSGETALTEAEMKTVTRYVVAKIRKAGRVPAVDADEIERATGVKVTPADHAVLQAAIVAEIRSDPTMAAKLDTNRCSDYGACSLEGDLAGASGPVLDMYYNEKKQDGVTLADSALHTVPSFSAFDLSGKAVTDKDLTGPTVLVFLAGHCSHSIDTVPVLNALHEKYQSKGVRVLGIVVNSGQPEEVRQWYPKLNAKYDVWVQPDAALGDAFGSHLVPSYFLLESGRVKTKLVGFKSADAAGRAVDRAFSL